MSFNFLNLLPDGEALVLTADGGVTGALTPRSSGIFDFALTQQGNEVHLSVGGANFQTGGLPGSQAAVAGHLQSIWDAGGNGDFGPVFASIENAAANGGYEDALADLSPGVALAPAARSGPAAQIFTNTLLSCPVFEGDGASLTEGSCGWARIAGRLTDQSENDGVAGFNNSRVTYQAGGQLEVADDWFVGGSLAYEMSWFSGDDDRVTSDGDAVFVGAAVKHTMDAWLFAASVGGGFGWYDTQRAVGMTGDIAKSSPDVQSVAGRLRAAYTLDQDSWYLRPIADLELIYVRAPGYSESGAGALDLEYDDAEQFTVAFSPALEVGGRVELGGGYVLRPFGLVGVSVLSNDDWEVSTRFAGAPGGTDSFETALPLDRVIGRVNAGVQLMAAEGFDVRLTYDGEFSSHITSHAGALTVAIPF
jgi:outer membrane autotransporter protein